MASGEGSGDGEGSYFGLEKQDFIIMIVVVCGGGALLLLGFGICICCFMRIKKRK
jgi:hypothetical protein